MTELVSNRVTTTDQEVGVGMLSRQLMLISNTEVDVVISSPKTQSQPSGLDRKDPNVMPPGKINFSGVFHNSGCTCSS